MKIKLLCLPYAGASATVYKKWERFLDERIEMYPIELSGRGKRCKEPFYDTMSEAVDDVYGIIRQDLDSYEFAFFGHSMGSVIGYELYYKIIEKDHRRPLHIFLSGRDAPHVEKENKNIHNSTFEKLKEEIVELGGTPEDLFEDEQLMDFYVPIIRADFKIVECYKYAEKPEKIKSNITVFHGTNDKSVSSSITEWQSHVENQCTIHRFDGGHFFINDYVQDIVNIINSTLTYEMNHAAKSDIKEKTF